MAPKTSDPIELIRQAQAGDEAAFAALLESCYDRMYGCALKYSGNKADAEDITQQACLKLARSLAQFRFESAFSTWTFRLVVNCGIDWYRSNRGAQALPEDQALLGATGDSSASIYLAQILDLVSTFGEGFREAVVLVLGEGLTHQDAAEVLGVKESTISWRIHETRKRLAAKEANHDG